MVVALIVLGTVGYIGLRAAEARHRGDDPAHAAAEALRDVGPPAVVAILAVVVAAAVAGLLGFLLFIALLRYVLAGDNGGFTTLVVFTYAAAAAAFIGCLAVAVWAVRRVRRHRR